MENNALSLQPFLVFPIMLRVIKMGRKRNDESTNIAISIVIFLFLYSCSRHYVHAESGISVDPCTWI